MLWNVLTQQTNFALTFVHKAVAIVDKSFVLN